MPSDQIGQEEMEKLQSEVNSLNMSDLKFGREAE